MLSAIEFTSSFFEDTLSLRLRRCLCTGTSNQHNYTTAFFGNRVINVCNNLSHDEVDFSTVKRFKSSLILSDLSKLLQYVLKTHG